MIQLMLTMFKDRSKAPKTLVAVANGHTRKGVKSFQYGIVGEVLLWTFSYCLGDAFTPEAQLAWKRLLSYCIAIILPVAVANDRQEDVKSLPTKADAASARQKESVRIKESIEASSVRTKPPSSIDESSEHSSAATPEPRQSLVSQTPLQPVAEEMSENTNSLVANKPT